MRFLALTISYLLIAIGFSSWFLVPKFFSNNVEIPLGDIKGFVVDSENNIYFGSGFYERIQVYNKKGEFLKNWNVESFGGTYIIDITKDDKIMITTARGDEEIIYDKNGKVVSRKKVNIIEYQNEFRDKDNFTTKSGVTYKLKGVFFTKLVSLNPEKTIIQQNIFLQLLKGPTNSWILMIAGGLLANLLKLKKEKHYV